MQKHGRLRQIAAEYAHTKRNKHRARSDYLYQNELVQKGSDFDHKKIICTFGCSNI